MTFLLISRSDTFIVRAVTLRQYPTSLKCFQRKGSHLKVLKYTLTIFYRDNNTVVFLMIFFFLIK